MKELLKKKNIKINIKMTKSQNCTENVPNAFKKKKSCEFLYEKVFNV